MDRTLAPDHEVHQSGRRIYRDRDIAQGLLGTLVAAEDRNSMQEELMAVIEYGQSVGARNLADNTPLTPETVDIANPRTYQQLLSAILHLTGQAVPAGTVVGSMRDVPPPGWFECNGGAVSRTTYAVLFAAIGVRFGSGDGSTTFNVPDLRGQFLRGWSHGNGIDPDVTLRSNRGDGAGGDVVGSRQWHELLSHKHEQLLDEREGVVLGTNESVDRMGGNTPVGLTGAAGGSETRPMNVYTMWMIKA